eukprot:1595296-Pleurochrysis_carterae.AAC.1
MPKRTARNKRAHADGELAKKGRAIVHVRSRAERNAACDDPSLINGPLKRSSTHARAKVRECICGYVREAASRTNGVESMRGVQVEACGRVRAGASTHAHARQDTTAVRTLVRAHSYACLCMFVLVSLPASACVRARRVCVGVTESACDDVSACNEICVCMSVCVLPPMYEYARAITAPEAPTSEAASDRGVSANTRNSA